MDHQSINDLKIIFLFQRSPRGPAERRKVLTVRSRAASSRQRRHELHAADEVHVQQPDGRNNRRTGLEKASRQLTCFANRILISNQI